MILYSPKKQSKYTVGEGRTQKPMGAKGMHIGLGDTEFVNDPALWNYLVIVSVLPFHWEDDKLRTIDKPASFNFVDEARRDLGRSVKGELVRKLVQTLNPMEFSEFVEDVRLNHLEVCKFFGGDSIGLKLIIKARAYTWHRSQGHKLSTDQKTIIKMVRKKW